MSDKKFEISEMLNVLPRGKELINGQMEIKTRILLTSKPRPFSLKTILFKGHLYLNTIASI